MFFELNRENRFGLRKLTDSDLGLANNTTTHIGLYDGVLTYLPDHIVQHSYVVYEGKFLEKQSYFDRIDRGGVPSTPKIRTGSRNEDASVVTFIREIVQDKPNQTFYLLWFGLQNEDIVYILLKDDSELFTSLFGSEIKLKRYYDLSDSKNNSKKLLLLDYFNTITEGLQIIIEEAAETGIKTRFFNPRDIEKANRDNKITGLRGEKSIKHLLTQFVLEKKITTFTWVNEEQETGLPYDFVITRNDGSVKYVDVKTTKNDFDSNVYFSSNEICFASNQNDSDYSIFRIYCDATEKKYFVRECGCCRDYMKILNDSIEKFINDIEDITEGAAIKLKVSPSDKNFKKIIDPVEIDFLDL